MVSNKAGAFIAARHPHPAPDVRPLNDGVQTQEQFCKTTLSDANGKTRVACNNKGFRFRFKQVVVL